MLNDQQRKAIHTTDGRVLILAGAGSGKTSVITHRIAHLIKNLNTPPTSILGLTFTNKAAEEMRTRVAGMINPSLAKQVMLCTFHSFCMQILRKEIHKLGYTKDFSLYDERDVRRLLNHLVREELGVDGDLPSLDPTYEAISLAKNKAQTPDEMEGDKMSKELYGRLQTIMRAYNAVDFDNLLYLTLQLFEEHPEVLTKYQTRFRYIMIDEYQDTNPIQYRLAKLLSASHNNLCVVGDDDQAIYGWRGAEIKNILQFESETVIKLEQNYRSTPTILTAANTVIRHNQQRHIKELWSTKEPGDLIEVFNAPNDQDEAAAVVMRMIAYNKNHKIPWSEMAILYRSNLLARPLELALMQACWEKEGQWRRGIPYQTFGGTEFSERAEIKDLAAYLRVISNPQDQEAILRIINVPRRGISDQALDKITQHSRTQKQPLWKVLHEVSELDGLSDRALKGIRHFIEIIEQGREKFAHPAFDEALRWLLETINYRKAIEEEVKSDKAREYKWENVEAFVQTSKEYTDLQEFLGTMALDDNQFSQREEAGRENKVNLMTFHSAKGLEFTLCFLVGLEDQIMPHEKSMAEGGLEEERRLMYVAMTRAKRYLTLSMARQRKRYGKDVNMTPSRFLFEIPKELIKVTSWKG
ncbi:MAG: ATP-dependent helicase [Verrucomicrobia bacterium]|nr:ATP-dependent helicase [Verrucomicrobiota bacterium]